MVTKIVQYSAWFFLLVLLVITEVIDWRGRMDAIEKNYPPLWKVLSDRPARLLVLLVALGFLAKDVRDATEIAPPPAVKITLTTPTSIVKYTPPDESQSSLRKRVAALANDVQAFWDDRNTPGRRPPYARHDPKDATPESLERDRVSDKYETESVRLCLGKFEDRTRGILEELKAKGVDMTPTRYSLIYPDAIIQQHRCLGQYDSDEPKALRQLGFQLDGSDKLVVF